MLVKNNALLMRVNDPGVIVDALPQAKILNFRGQEIVAVRHSLDAARVLNNLGLNAPSPILHGDYEFTGRYTPFEKQLLTAQFFTLHNRAYCFSQMRTGKTGAALWASDYLLNIGEVKRVLVVSPLTVTDVWVNEAFSIVPHRSIAQLLGSQDKRIRLANEPTSYSIINFDGLRTLYHEEYYPKSKRVKRRWSDLEGLYDLIIVDEAEAYCNPQTWRWKALRQLITPETKLWMMTGTPNPNAPTDSYGLVKLMHPERVPASYKLFEESMMRPVGPYKKVPRDGAVDAAYALMQPAIRFRRDECTDLPTTTSPRHCEMSKTQQKVFDDVRAKMRHEDEDVEITAVNAAVKLLKLQQIMCGVVKDDNGEPVELNPKHRLELVEHLIKEAAAKTVVFVPFKPVMRMVSEYLISKGITSEVMNGDNTKQQRTDILRRFTNSADPHVLVAHPKVAAHGIDLTVADTFIWYAPVFSTGQYEQANARGEGPKKSRPVGIYHIGCHPVEWKIYDVLAKKADLQSSLLDLYQSVFD